MRRNTYMPLLTKKDLDEVKDRGLKSIYPEKTKVAVGMSTCGRASGAEEVLEAIKDEASSRGLDTIVTSTGCMGLCQREPLVDILRPGWPRIVYEQMDVKKSREIISALTEDKIIPKYTLCKIEEEPHLIENTTRKYRQNGLPEGIEKVPLYQEVPFFGKQQKRVLQGCGTVNPDKIEEYIASGGYTTLCRALKELDPREVIDEVIRSGLRGRGGAGFPTGRKWDFCRKAEGEPKYVICNADEGDPGAYMDRSILEGNPHRVIEGMIIGAFAIGARYGIMYIRAEYPLAIEKLTLALDQARELGLIGGICVRRGDCLDSLH